MQFDTPPGQPGPFVSRGHGDVVRPSQTTDKNPDVVPLSTTIIGHTIEDGTQPKTGDEIESK